MAVVRDDQEPGEAQGAWRTWHSSALAELETHLQTGPHGLTSAQVEVRQAHVGPNTLQERAPPSTLGMLAHQFQSPLIYILVAASVITLVLSQYLDAAVIVGVVMVNAVIGFVQERQADRSMRALRQLVAPRARVIRAGQEWDVPAMELVPGDLVLLESGTRVPADLRLRNSTALTIDESLLTGESLPAHKHPAPLPAVMELAERANMAYAGTTVSSGRGQGYVVAIANGTELGAIATQLRNEPTTETPLQEQLSRFARAVGLVCALAAGLAFTIGIAQGEAPGHMFMLAVALAVAAIPEGLPVALTITLAVGVRRMARRQAVIRRLPAVETLGSTTVIGSDKTGTLTENRMTVRQLWAGGQWLSLGTGEADPPAPNPQLAAADAALYQTLLVGVLTNEATVYQSDAGVQSQGDPTEVALLLAAQRAGLEPELLRTDYSLEADVPFEPGRQYSASLRLHAGERHLVVKGAPERVLSMCVTMLAEHGPVPLETAPIHDALQEMAARGLRVIGMASRHVGHEHGEVLSEPEDLTFLGLVGMQDPPRAGVREAIGSCQAAGIRVVMITGDHAATAQTIATELGISGQCGAVLSGSQLAELDDAALWERMRGVNVYARVTPEDKLRIVRALQHHGEVVAVTGDGVNDAPALKAADIGIAMGRGGTDVAREAADMVLVDDNFVSISAAVEEGRITLDNLRRVVSFLLSTGLAAVIVILVALLLQWDNPLLPTPILWLNLVTNTVQAMALAFEPGDRAVLRRGPRRPNEGILSPLLWERLALSGFVMAAGTLFLFRWELGQGGSLAQAQTVALTTMVLFQMFQVGNARSQSRSLLCLSPRSNPFLLAATAAATMVHAAALYLPPTRYLLGVEPIALSAWLRIALVAASILVAIELHKLVRRERGQTGRWGTYWWGAAHGGAPAHSREGR